MIFDMKTAAYVNVVVSALEAGKVFPDPQMSNKCPECGEWLGYFNTGDHVVWDASTDEDPEKVIVIIACEGYWVIDPNLVGIMSDTWMAQDDPKFLGEELSPVGASDTSAGIAPDGLGDDTSRAFPSCRHKRYGETDRCIDMPCDNYVGKSREWMGSDYPSLP